MRLCVCGVGGMVRPPAGGASLYSGTRRDACTGRQGAMRFGARAARAVGGHSAPQRIGVVFEHSIRDAAPMCRSHVRDHTRALDTSTGRVKTVSQSRSAAGSCSNTRRRFTSHTGITRGYDWVSTEFCGTVCMRYA